MKTRLIGIILLFLATYFLMLNSVLAAPFPGTCNAGTKANPITTLTLKTGTTATVTYYCSEIPGLNYKLTFTTTPSGLTVTPTGYAKTPSIKVKAGQTTGTFSVMINMLNLGTGELPVPNQTALTVIVPKPDVSSSNFVCTPDPVQVNKQSDCSITYTNSDNGSNATGVAVTPSVKSGPGSVTVTTACPTKLASGDSCTEKFTYTSSTAGSGNLSVTYSDNQGGVVAPATKTITVNPKPAPDVTAGNLSCTTPINKGSSSTCTITYTNSGNEDATGIAISSPTAHTSTPSQCTGNKIAKNGGTCTSTFTYTPTTTGTKTLTANFSATGISTISKTASVKVNPKPTPSVSATPMTCTPNPINVKGKSICDISYNNTGTANATGVIITPSVSSGAGTAEIANFNCGTTIPTSPPYHCTASIKYTAPATPGTNTVMVKYSDAENERITKTATVTVQGIPDVSETSFTCNPATIDNGDTSTCTIVYKNSGTADATGVTISSPTPHTRTPSPCTNNTIAKNGGTCTSTFTYTAPVTASQGSVSITANYTDAVEKDIPPSYASVVVWVPIVDSSNFSCNPSTVQYGDSTSCSITFTNYGEADAKELHIKTSTPAGQGSLGHPGGSCHSKSTLKKNNHSCNATFTYTAPESSVSSCPLKPNPILGRHCKVITTLSYLGGSVPSTNYVPISLDILPPTTRAKSLSPAPIFSEVVTNRDFIKSTEPSAPKFGGAFVFQNNTANKITGMKPVIQTLSRAFESTTCDQVSLLHTTYTDCSLVHHYLNSGKTCAACFIEKSGAKRAKSYTFSGKLKYKGNSTTASKTITTNPQYRQITVKNHCSDPIWVAFSTDIAYRSCKDNSDCPARSKCVKGQCKVPTPSSGQTGCNRVHDVCPQFSTCSPSNGHCYWHRPTLTVGSSKLKRGQQAIYQIPNIAKNAANNVWQGSIVARTGCSIKSGKFSCVTGDCGNTNTTSACPIGQAPAQPVTEAKFSLQLKSKDSYYVDISHGFNIPLVIKPVGTLAGSNPYFCHAAGCTNTSGHSARKKLDLIWMKNACPSAKVFSNDTAASLFTCNSNKKITSKKINKQNYSVTFCPTPGGVDKVNSTRMHQESLLKRIMHKLEGFAAL